MVSSQTITEWVGFGSISRFAPVCATVFCLISLAAHAVDSPPELQTPGTTAQEAFLIIRESKSAELTIEGGNKILVLEGAFLEYRGAYLKANQARVDSIKELAELEGNVFLSYENFEARCGSATLDGHSGEVSLDNGIYLSSRSYELEIEAEAGRLFYIKDTRKPFKAKLSGNVKARFRNAKLTAENLSYLFENGTLTTDEPFNISVSLKPGSGAPKENLEQELDLQKLIIDGGRLFARMVNEPQGQKVEILALKVKAKYLEQGEVQGSILTARILMESSEKPEGSAQEPIVELFQLTGSSTEPVKGKFIDETGKEYYFIANRLEGNQKEGIFELVGDVSVKSEEVVLNGQRIILAMTKPTFRVTLPERFRAEFSSEFLQRLIEREGETEGL